LRVYLGRKINIFSDERAGNLIFVVKDTDVIPKIKSQVTFLIRGMYSNAPSHGARIVTHILNNPTLCEQWKGCITVMTARYKDMRAALREALERLNTPGNWSHLTSQIGMFSYIGLDGNSYYLDN
jgi:aspartate aminotransferase